MAVGIRKHFEFASKLFHMPVMRDFGITLFKKGIAQALIKNIRWWFFSINMADFAYLYGRKMQLRAPETPRQRTLNMF